MSKYEIIHNHHDENENENIKENKFIHYNDNSTKVLSARIHQDAL